MRGRKAGWMVRREVTLDIVGRWPKGRRVVEEKKVNRRDYYPEGDLTQGTTDQEVR